jgi:hypothetical protein
MTSLLAAQDGDLSMALYGSFLPVPKLSVFGAKEEQFESPKPGALICVKGDIELNKGRPISHITVTNTADR